MAPRRRDPKAVADTGILSAEQKRAIRAEALDLHAKDMEQAARDAYFKEMLAEAQRKDSPDDQLVYCTIDLAPFMNRILIDNVEYFHGYIYEVPMYLFRVLIEQMQRSWMHQDEIDGRSRAEAQRRPRHLQIGPQHAGTSTHGFAPGHLINAEI